MKFVTMDIEGDGLSRDINQKIFPEGGHYDPDTRLWCVTFAIRDITRTYVCKLPNKPRELPNGMKTKAYHEDATKVPEYIGKHKIKRFRIYSSFIYAIYNTLLQMEELGYKVYFKGYDKFDYDRDMLEMKFKEFNIPTDTLNNLYNINKEMNITWKKTYDQVTTGKWLNNQEYMESGIRHNIEDAIQLYEVIEERVKKLEDRVDELALQQYEPEYDISEEPEPWVPTQGASIEMVQKAMRKHDEWEQRHKTKIFRIT